MHAVGDVDCCQLVPCPSPQQHFNSGAATQVYGDEASTVIAGLQPLDGGEADFFAMTSAGEAHVDLEALRCASRRPMYRP